MQISRRHLEDRQNDWSWTQPEDGSWASCSTVVGFLCSFFSKCEFVASGGSAAVPISFLSGGVWTVGLQDVQTIVDKMNPSSSPWGNSITLSMIRQAIAACSETSHISKMHRGRVFPDPWKQAVVITIPKKGEKNKTKKRGRPISLLPVPGKIMERLIIERLKPQLLPLNTHQHGFKKGKSTVSAIEKMIFLIRWTHRRRPNTNRAKSLDRYRLLW